MLIDFVELRLELSYLSTSSITMVIWSLGAIHSDHFEYLVIDYLFMHSLITVTLHGLSVDYIYV